MLHYGPGASCKHAQQTVSLSPGRVKVSPEVSGKCYQPLVAMNLDKYARHSLSQSSTTFPEQETHQGLLATLPHLGTPVPDM